MKIKEKSTCQYDLVSLGEVMLRMDPGDGRIRTTRCNQIPLNYGLNINKGVLMSHQNILPFNQLAISKHGVHNQPEDQDVKLEEYYECLIECDEQYGQSSCRRVCREILM